MVRPLRVLVEDGTYHVTARGNARAAIFIDDVDRSTFLAGLGRTARRFDWRCLMYCLMDNHVHLLVRTPQPNLARGMQQLKGRYAQQFNRRHERVGHLFAGRYGAVLVQRDAHLLEVCRYIANNPVRAGLCDDPLGWRWSSHAAVAGHAAPPDFLAVEDVHAVFAAKATGDGRAAYRTFVRAGTGAGYPRDGVVFGDEAFARTVLPASRPDEEIAVRDWGPGRPPIEDLLAERSDDAIARAYLVHGYSMQAIAAQLGCHTSTVSRRVAAFERDCKV